MAENRFKQYWTTDRIMRLLIALTIAAALVVLLNYLSDVLLPFFVACLAAYLLEPLVAWNMRVCRTRRRGLGAALTLLEVTSVLALAVYLFVPTVVKEVGVLGDILRSVSSGEKEMPPLYRFVIDFVNRYFNADSIRDFMSGAHIDALLSRGSSLLEESLGFVVRVLAWMLTFIYVVFVIVDYPQIVRGFKMIFPRKYRTRGWSVVREVQGSMNGYFRGQGFVALCAMAFYCTGFSIVGLPLGIPMGLLVGVLYMIPYFQYVTLVPVAVICLIYSFGGTTAFLPEFGKCLLVYLVSQCVCDYVITPHVMGREIGLNPAMILLSLSVWGSLLGIIGMIIALPATALIMTYYERYISNPAPARGGADEALKVGEGEL